jgi:hypothetical protein
MPRAAVLSIHARVARTEPTAYADPSLVQIWGPRFSAFVVAAPDVAVFTLGRYPDDERGRRVAEQTADRLRDLLGDREITYGEAGRALGVPPNSLRYATTTGTLAIRWHGARQPTIRILPRPDVDPADARLELARRFLHVFGPATPGAFAKWAGISARAAASTFEALPLAAVRTPTGEARILAGDEAGFRSPIGTAAPARLLPSGDTFTLGEDREVVVPDAGRRRELWPSRVWPGAILVDGDLAGTWRRAGRVVDAHPWGRLSRGARDAIEAEAASLPLPELADGIVVRWQT